MAAIWILLVGGFHRDEMIVGAFCVLGAIIILRLIAGVHQQELQITLVIFSQDGEFPGTPPRDVFIVSLALLRCLLSGVQPASAYRVCGFKPARASHRTQECQTASNFFWQSSLALRPRSAAGFPLRPRSAAGFQKPCK